MAVLQRPVSDPGSGDFDVHLTAGVERLAHEMGADLVGVASADAFEGAPAGHRPENLLRGARSVVAVAVHLLDGAFELAPSREYSITFQVACQELNRIAYHVARYLQGQGYRALQVPGSPPYDLERNMGDLSHRHAGRLAGIGVFGKSCLLLSPEFSPTTLDLMGHIDDYLELSIRVRGEYERPARTLESFSRRNEISPALAGEVKHWIRSLGELGARKPAPRALEEARRLMEDASDAQRFRDERDALVYYLQAGSVLHRYLEGHPTDLGDQAAAYYMLGVIETRVGQSFWLSQAEVFLESAIRTAPSSDVAQKSYDLLEEFLVAGYTGSGGVQVPPDIQAKLDELRRIVEEARAGA